MHRRPGRGGGELGIEPGNGKMKSKIITKMEKCIIFNVEIKE